MSVILGTGSFTFEALDKWETLPPGVSLVECPGVAVDSRDRVYVLTRNTEHPVMVFEQDGTFVTSFGRGVFTNRTHGIFIGQDDTVYCVDDGTHTITKFTGDGKLLMTIGERGKPSAKWGGDPFNLPTHAAVSVRTGNIYITDGYGNARVHKYTSDGRLLLSWGSSGIDPGQFIWPHNITVDAEDRVYVADREAHRVQVFDADGAFITMWSNIHRPDGLTIGPDGNIYIGELNGMEGTGCHRISILTPQGELLARLGEPEEGEEAGKFIDGAPGLGHRISILTPQGELLARLGEPEEGEEPGKFIAPHGIAVDSHARILVMSDESRSDGGMKDADITSALGVGQSTVERAARYRGRLAGGHIRRRGLLHDSGPELGPAARAEEPQEASEGRRVGRRVRGMECADPDKSPKHELAGSLRACPELVERVFPRSA